MGEIEAVDGLSDYRREQFERLICLRNAPDDIGEWIFQTNDIPDDVLAAAVTYAIRTRVFFPVPAELRADADAGSVFRLSPPAVALEDRDRERLLAAPRTIEGTLGGDHFAIPIVREWRYDCDSCHDTGWADFWCGPHGADDVPGQPPWLPIRGCHRRQEHTPHHYVTECACRPTNPTIKRREEARARKYAGEKSK